jgi:hypothetical protein
MKFDPNTVHSEDDLKRHISLRMMEIVKAMGNEDELGSVVAGVIIKGWREFLAQKNPAKLIVYDGLVDKIYKALNMDAVPGKAESLMNEMIEDIKNSTN